MSRFHARDNMPSNVACAFWKVRVLVVKLKLSANSKHHNVTVKMGQKVKMIGATTKQSEIHTNLKISESF